VCVCVCVCVCVVRVVCVYTYIWGRYRCVKNKRTRAYCEMRHPLAHIRGTPRETRETPVPPSASVDGGVQKKEKNSTGAAREWGGRVGGHAGDKVSVFVGVGWSKQKQKWRARAGQVHVGFFEDEYEAAQVCSVLWAVGCGE